MAPNPVAGQAVCIPVIYSVLIFGDMRILDITSAVAYSSSGLLLKLSSKNDFLSCIYLISSILQ